MPPIAQPKRRYAEWTPGYAGAPPLVGGYYLFSLVCLFLAVTFRFAENFAGLIAPLMQAIGHVTRLYNPVVRRRVDPLRDLPSAATQYAVRFALGREWTYAADEGLASFVDGWLVVQGVGCAFSVRASDVSTSAAQNSLTFQGLAGTHHLTFSFSERGFREAWDVWRKAMPPIEGEPVFPPVRPPSRLAHGNHALYAAILGVAAFAIPFHGLAAWPWLLSIVGSVVLLNRRARRSAARAHARIAQGKPARRSAWRILGAEVHLERLGEAYRADRRRRKRRRALVRRTNQDL